MANIRIRAPSRAPIARQSMQATGIACATRYWPRMSRRGRTPLSSWNAGRKKLSPLCRRPPALLSGDVRRLSIEIVSDDQVVLELRMQALRTAIPTPEM